MTYQTLVARIDGRRAFVDACLPIQLVDGLKSHGIEACWWIPHCFGASAKDDYIESQLGDAVLITRDVAFANRLGDRAILLKGFIHRHPRLTQDPPETQAFKIKRHMRLLFCRRTRKGMWEMT